MKRTVFATSPGNSVANAPHIISQDARNGCPKWHPAQSTISLCIGITSGMCQKTFRCVGPIIASVGRPTVPAKCAGMESFATTTAADDIRAAQSRIDNP